MTSVPSAHLDHTPPAARKPAADRWCVLVEVLLAVLDADVDVLLEVELDEVDVLEAVADEAPPPPPPPPPPPLVLLEPPDAELVSGETPMGVLLVGTEEELPDPEFV